MEEKRLFELIMGSEKNQLEQIIKCNDVTQKFGLRLSNKEGLELLKNKNDILKTQERIEFGEGILTKIIFTFCDSPFIYQDNYVEMIEGLTEIFYLYKNESMDELTDDELLAYMKSCFDGKCQGDLDYLEGTCLEAFCREIREKGPGIMGIVEDE
ncbi:MAG: hypothetical protein H2184_14355 [Candidatus Galacturonibacter soehngenii]|nr:hypothetical protein [Candidatus Galacturonibacter soehngenii]